VRERCNRKGHQPLGRGETADPRFGASVEGGNLVVKKLSLRRSAAAHALGRDGFRSTWAVEGEAIRPS